MCIGQLRPHVINGLHVTIVFAMLAMFAQYQVSCEVTKTEKAQLKSQVIEMFNHAYNSYMQYAYPADELMPLSCKGRYRGSEPDRGDIDESLGNFSLTLIDTLDTLAVFGNITEFDNALQLVIKNVKFDADVIVSVFETNIRVLGGLLGGHVMADVFKKENKGLHWYKGELLDMAVDIADRLLVAFNTSTGIPYPKINLRYGVHHPLSRIVDESDTCTACAGTMIMEFAALSRLTGNPMYEEKAHNAMDAIWHYRSRNSDLVGTVINIHNGDWIRRDSGIGAGIDSYYEYCFKAYVLLGDKSYLEKFNKHYAAINKYIKQGVMMLDVLMHQPDRPIRAFVDSLQAFWPGLQVLMGDLKPAIETHEMLYEVVKRHKFIPEAFTTSYDVYWAQHPLRPEFAESTYFLYEATKDPYYLEAGKHIVETLDLHARVPCGFAAIQDLRTFAHEDKMDSFVLAETFKYLYLLFSEESDRILDIHNFIFTTEAHLLPLSLSNVNLDKKNNRTLQNTTRQASIVLPASDIQSTCPNNALNQYNLKEFARIVRKEYRKPQQDSKCSSQNTEQQLKDAYLNSDPNRQPKLRADQFQVGNAMHLQLLKAMGISVIQTNDGKVQLVHQAGVALTPEDATDGIKFMQDMIQFAKTKNNDQGSGYKPRVVQVLSPPYNGKAHFGAGAAQFGLDISKSIGVTGEVIESIPYNACDDIMNPDEFLNRIIVAQRGSCMFIDKVRRAQKHGALGVIIIDHNEGTSADDQPVFAMSGDNHSEDVSIPSVFLFRKEGDILRQFAQRVRQEFGLYLSVRLTGKVSQPEAKPNEAEVSDSNPGLDSDGKPEINKAYDSEKITSEKSFDVKQCKNAPTQWPHVLNSKPEETEVKSKILDQAEPGTIVKSSTESHVGRDSDGKLVTFETTYTTYADSSSGENISRIRVATKTIPFESDSLEIGGEGLRKAVKDESIPKVVAEESGGKESIDSNTAHKGVEYVGDSELKGTNEADALKKRLDVAIEEDKAGGIKRADVENNVVRETIANIKDHVNEIEEGTHDKQDRKIGDWKPEIISNVQKEMRDEEVSQEEVVKILKPKHQATADISDSKQDSDNNIISEKQVIEDDGQENLIANVGGGDKEKQGGTDVMCNSAGCFSSLEELQMFNAMAEEVKSHIEQISTEETFKPTQEALTHDNSNDKATRQSSNNYDNNNNNNDNGNNNNNNDRR
eukprot:gene17887-19669_t